MQPIAARDADVSYDRLHHFLASGVWDAAPLETALLAEADRQVGGDAAWLIIDRHGLAEEGAPRGWCRTTICLGARQDFRSAPKLRRRGQKGPTSTGDTPDQERLAEALKVEQIRGDSAPGCLTQSSQPVRRLLLEGRALQWASRTEACGYTRS